MKWYKKLGVIVSTLALATYLIGSTMPLYIEAVEESSEFWVENVNKVDYNTWRQDLEMGFEGYDWLKDNYSDKLTDEKNIQFNPDTNLASSGYPIDLCGSILFSMSKLMVATGLTSEYSAENTDGVNPYILYLASMISYNEVENGIRPNSLEKGRLYSNNVRDWVDNPEYLIETVNKYWGDKLNIDQVSSIKKTKSNLKQEYLQSLMDNGKYIIVSVDNYYYWDDKSNKLIDGDATAKESGYENPKHSILLTGYEVDDDGKFIDFTMDDSLSPATMFTDVYTYEDISQISTFTTLPGIDSKLDFYINKEATIPWYLKLVSKEEPILEKDTKLLPLVDVSVTTGKKIVNKSNDGDIVIDDTDTEAINDNDDNAEPTKSIDNNKTTETVIVDKRITADLANLVKDMLAECSEESDKFEILSGYNTFKEQTDLYKSAKETYGDEVDLYEADAGSSEHNLGYCIDFNIKDTNDFETTECFKWLCNNAHNYGFILRYPKGSTPQKTTGRNYDPSHWRYIGKSDAVDFIKFIGASYEEEDDNLINVDAYLNVEYNDKVYEDYYNEIIKERYKLKDDVGDGKETDEDLSKKQKYSDATLRRIYYLLRHPIKAIGNFFAGLAQLLHNAIAVGRVGNLFNISWIINWDFLKPFIKYYIIISTIVVVTGLLFRYLKYMFKSGDNLATLLRDNATYILYGMIPLFLINFIGNCFDGINEMMIDELTGNIIATETMLSSLEEEKDAIEKAAEDDDKVSKMEILTDEDLALTMFRETFSDGRNGDSYEYSTIKMAMTDSDGESVYKDIPVIDLYNSISWATDKEFMFPNRVSSSVSANASPFNVNDYLDKDTEDETDINMSLDNTPSRDNNMLEPTIFETTEGLAIDDINNAYIDDLVPQYMYYSCNEFVPVHYNYYDDSVFYYFYDWVKYQYLAYWAYANNDKGTALTNFAKQYVLPGEPFESSLFSLTDGESLDDETFEGYLNRIEYLENNYLAKAKSGMYLMYEDERYVKSEDLYNNDLFGLSNLFNMTTMMVNNATTNTTIVMPDDMYYNANSLEIWAGAVKINYLNNMPTYEEFRGMIISNDYSYISVPAISNIIGSMPWSVYSNSTLLKDNPNNGGMTKWKFTPTYLENEFKYNREMVIRDDIYNSKRVPWRLYASEGDLYRAYDDKHDIESTSLERRLCRLNNSIFKDVKKITKYMPGQITDDVMIFIVALVATSKFNEMFNTNISKVYPASINTEDLDMDKLTRLTYADNLVTTKSLDTMYMIYDSPGGLFVVICVILSELLMLLASMSRMGVLIMFFVASCLLAINLMRGKSPITSTLLKGVFTQLVFLILSQALFIIVNVLILNVLSQQSQAMSRIVVSTLGVLVYFVLTVISMAMLMIFIKDMKHYGGMLIQDAVNTVTTQLDESFSVNIGGSMLINNAKMRLEDRRKRHIINDKKLYSRNRKRNNVLLNNNSAKYSNSTKPNKSMKDKTNSGSWYEDAKPTKPIKPIKSRKTVNSKSTRNTTVNVEFSIHKKTNKSTTSTNNNIKENDKIKYYSFGLANNSKATENMFNNMSNINADTYTLV